MLRHLWHHKEHEKTLESHPRSSGEDVLENPRSIIAQELSLSIQRSLPLNHDEICPWRTTVGTHGGYRGDKGMKCKIIGLGTPVLAEELGNGEILDDVEGLPTVIEADQTIFAAVKEDFKLS